MKNVNIKEPTVSESLVKLEFERSTEKFQVITFLVGLVLNLAWVISDYYVLREYIVPFFSFRLAVSLVGVLFLFLRKRLQLSIYFCLFVFVCGISIQNAYMWSVMDLSHFQKHAFAYIVLFIGVGMLVLWEFKYSVVLGIITVLANLVYYSLNSSLSAEDFLINGGLITFSVLIFSVFLIRTRYRLTYSEIRFRLELEQSKNIVEQKHNLVVSQKKEIQNQKDSLEVKNKEITDSINYAKSIQNALISSEQKFKTFFTDSFVLFQPKDIVSGDFYWVHEKGQVVFYVTADCTGHGVPGGFMTMLGLTFLDQIISFQNIQDPAQVLTLMKEKIISALNKSGNILENKDGMDLTICRLDKKTNQLQFSGANNNLYIVRHTDKDQLTKEITIYKGDRQPCGPSLIQKAFTTITLNLNKGDCVYTLTDGYSDQFGGPKGRKFRYKQFEEVLLQYSHFDFAEQKEALTLAHSKWRGTLEQVDDILVIGIKV